MFDVLTVELWDTYGKQYVCHLHDSYVTYGLFTARISNANVEVSSTCMALNTKTVIDNNTTIIVNCIFIGHVKI